MPTILDIPLAPLDAQAFAPFGEIVGGRDSAPVFSGPHIQSWRLAFEAEGAVELMVASYIHQPMEFTTLESHLNVTQGFFPLGDHPSVMVVAPPGDAAPEADSLRAFLVPGNLGMLLGRRTWHALTRFPARPSGATFALLTSAETQAELERQNADGTQPRLTRVADYAENRGLSFRVIDPRGLLADV